MDEAARRRMAKREQAARLGRVEVAVKELPRRTWEWVDWFIDTSQGQAIAVAVIVTGGLLAGVLEKLTF